LEPEGETRPSVVPIDGCPGGKSGGLAFHRLGKAGDDDGSCGYSTQSFCQMTCQQTMPYPTSDFGLNPMFIPENKRNADPTGNLLRTENGQWEMVLAISCFRKIRSFRLRSAPHPLGFHSRFVCFSCSNPRFHFRTHTVKADLKKREQVQIMHISSQIGIALHGILGFTSSA
jgi:hypothetical protein